MRPEGSRAPLRTSTRINNSIYSAGYNSHNHNNYLAYQALFDDQNGSFVGNNWNCPLFNAQNRVPSGLLSPSATPPLMSNSYWPIVQQLPFVPPSDWLPRAYEDVSLSTLNSSTVGSSYDSYTTAPAWNLSPSLLANEAAAHETDNRHQSQQRSFGSLQTAASPSSLASEETAFEVGGWQLAQRSLSPPLTAATAASFVSSAPSRPYQCTSCPDAPTFNSVKDLNRHLLAKAHWSDETRFYRCCCRAQSPRKDHHKRHLTTCAGPAHVPYACICGMESDSRDEHIDHIEDCGRRRRRRQQSTS